MNKTSIAVILSVAALSVGCSTVNTSPNVYRANQALQNHNSQVIPVVVASVRDVRLEHDSSVAGPAVGAAIGVGLGSLIGGGRGTKIAQGVGALLMGSVGERFERGVRAEDGQEIIVRLPTGKMKAFVQAKEGVIVAGQRAYVVGVGREARVVNAGF